ncbi:hypothetical protein AABB02_25135 [Streptomyces rimosus]|uniref:hypothetical protein n=1 Tax=Streptomyces rimosus TaxID=1927 RepID=UPI0031DE2EFE
MTIRTEPPKVHATPYNLHKHPTLWPFFTLVLLLLLPCWTAGALIDLPGLPKNAPVTDYVAGFTPALAAVLLTARSQGREGVRRLLKRAWGPRGIGRTWWLPVILLSPLLYVTTYGLMRLTGARFLAQPAQTWQTMLLFVPLGPIVVLPAVLVVAFRDPATLTRPRGARHGRTEDGNQGHTGDGKRP